MLVAGIGRLPKSRARLYLVEFRLVTFQGEYLPEYID